MNNEKDFIYRTAESAYTKDKMAEAVSSAFFPLQSAVLCANCDNVSNANTSCPACGGGSENLLSLSRVLGGNVKQASPARKFDFSAVEITPEDNVGGGGGTEGSVRGRKVMRSLSDEELFEIIKGEELAKQFGRDLASATGANWTNPQWVTGEAAEELLNRGLIDGDRCYRISEGME